jgi:hypothetical protein
LDGIAVASKEVNLTGGVSEQLTFVTSTDVPGTHTITINGVSSTFEVKEVPTEPSPRPTTEPITPSEPPIEPGIPEEPINRRLIGGIIGGCVAAGLSIYFYIRRRRRLSRST